MSFWSLKRPTEEFPPHQVSSQVALAVRQIDFPLLSVASRVQSRQALGPIRSLAMKLFQIWPQGSIVILRCVIDLQKGAYLDPCLQLCAKIQGLSFLMLCCTFHMRCSDITKGQFLKLRALRYDSQARCRLRVKSFVLVREKEAESWRK